MYKFLIVLTLTAVAVLQTLPAYCAGSRTEILQVSATLPPHAMLGNSPFSRNLDQSAQTEMMVRDNKMMQVTSIVVQ